MSGYDHGRRGIACADAARYRCDAIALQRHASADGAANFRQVASNSVEVRAAAERALHGFRFRRPLNLPVLLQ